MMESYTAQELLSSSHSDLLEEIILLISLSFTEDPGTKWLFHSYTRERYTAALPSYMRFLVKAALGADASVTVIMGDTSTSITDKKVVPSQPEQVQLSSNSRVKAVGLLIPPHGNATLTSAWNILRAGLLTVLYRCGWAPVYRVIKNLAPAMDAMAARIYPNSFDRHNHWHVMFLATHPNVQCKGLGTQIVREFQRIVYEAARRQGDGGKIAPLYLEASTKRNKRLYSRIGFVERDSMTYGDLAQGEDLKFVEGQVLGGRQFGMEWIP